MAQCNRFNCMLFTCHCFLFRFELFGGNINGEFIELVPNKKIVKSWRCNQWPAGHFSTVTLDLEEMVNSNFHCFLQY